MCKDVSAPSLGCAGTGGCQLVGDKQSTVYALGDASGPRVEGSDLVLQYRNGSMCGDSDIQRSMTIFFECDESAGLEGSLIALEEKKTCHYDFLWQTSAACPLEADHSDGCRVTDERTGQVFDLTTLASKFAHRDLHITSDSSTYHIGLCNSNQYCPEGVAVCDGHRTSFGKANSDLTFNQDTLFLTYVSGDTCDDGRTRSTVVQFRCV